VFGGLYLPHLREAIWRNLAVAESELRRGEVLEAEVLDLDGDGHEEIWVHSDQFSALVSPRRGAAVEEYTVFAAGMNYANTLTRRRESYHDTALDHGSDAHSGGGAPSIHDIEQGLRFEQRPAHDADPRALLVERILPGDLRLDQYASGNYRARRSWAQASCSYRIERTRDLIEIECWFTAESGGGRSLEKRLTFTPDGNIAVAYSWDHSEEHRDDFFASEISLFAPLELRTQPAADVWSFSIETVAKSERGFDRTRQGDSVTLRWPAYVSQAAVVLDTKVPALVG
jgi:hypothetical protein